MNVLMLILCSVAVNGLTACEAKTPKSIPEQEIAPPLAEAPGKADPSQHGHSTQIAPDAAPTPRAEPEPSAELAAFTKAKPVFKKYCAKCHAASTGKRAALKHFVMDANSFSGPHASSMPATIRKVMGQSGKRATMPKDNPGRVSGNELKLILEWADAAERAASTQQKPTDSHDGHEHQH